MRITKEAYEILKETCEKEFRNHNIPEDPRQWKLDDKKNINEYIYFNHVGFLVIFPNCSSGTYKAGDQVFNYRARLPESIAYDLTNSINDLFSDCEPLASGRSLAREVKEKRLLDLLCSGDPGDPEIRVLVKKLINSTPTSPTSQASNNLLGDNAPMEIQFINTTGEKLVNQTLRITNETFDDLTRYLKKKGAAVSYTIDLHDDPESLRKIMSLPSNMTEQDLFVLNDILSKYQVGTHGDLRNMVITNPVNPQPPYVPMIKNISTPSTLSSLSYRDMVRLNIQKLIDNKSKQ